MDYRYKVSGLQRRVEAEQDSQPRLVRRQHAIKCAELRQRREGFSKALAYSQHGVALAVEPFLSDEHDRLELLGCLATILLQQGLPDRGLLGRKSIRPLVRILVVVHEEVNAGVAEVANPFGGSRRQALVVLGL